MSEAVAQVLELGQLREWLSAFVVRRTRSLGDQVRVARAMQLPRLPWRPGGDEVWAVAVVRDEADIVEAVIDHLLDQGVDHVLIADHSSADGTREAIRRRATADPRVHVALDSMVGHFQMEKMSWLAQRAWWAGARWVIPFDADEFWFAAGRPIAAELRDRTEAVLVARVHNMVAVGRGLGPDSFRSQVFSVDVGSPVPSKVAFRAHPLALLAPGNHGVDRHGAVSARGLVIAHVPYRGLDQVRRKLRAGAAAVDVTGAGSDIAWHWRAGAAMSEQELAAAWARVQRLEPVPELGWSALGPFVTRPVLTDRSWSTADPATATGGGDSA